MYYEIILSIISFVGLLCALAFTIIRGYRYMKTYPLSKGTKINAAILFLLSIAINTAPASNISEVLAKSEIFPLKFGAAISIGVFLASLISIFQLLLPVTLLIYVFYKTKTVDNVSADALLTDHVDQFVQKVYNDQRFYTAFNEVIPKNDDGDLGYDYLPKMFQAIENRRTEHKKNARWFLFFTIVLGLSFVITVIFFGLMLLNDEGAGLGKEVRVLRQAIETANKNLITLDKIDSTDFIKLNINLQHFNSIDHKLEKGPGYQKIKIAIARFDRDHDFERLYQTYSSVKDSLNLNYSGETAFNKYVEDLGPIMETHYKSLANAKEGLTTSVIQARRTLPKVEEELKKPENQLHETIKRLILSVVMISFFIAILRYVAKIYLTNHRLMVQAENEDLALRKYYIGLRNTDKDKADRKVVIEQLVSNSAAAAQKEDDGEPLSKEETGILKELLNNLMKKL